MREAEQMALRCVIVDDSPRFLEAARALLEQEGIEVVGVAWDAATARRLIDELRPDVTLVDVDLGAESGFDLARELEPHSKVILISTHAEEDLAGLIKASPALAFVAKTRLSAQAILEALERAA
jgi:two-component system, NarL family, nitrate/nitrite response regulator NarL